MNHNNQPLLLERMIIENLEKLVLNLKDKNMYVISIKNLNEALKHGWNSKSLIGILDLN